MIHVRKRSRSNRQTHKTTPICERDNAAMISCEAEPSLPTRKDVVNALHKHFQKWHPHVAANARGIENAA